MLGAHDKARPSNGRLGLQHDVREAREAGFRCRLRSPMAGMQCGPQAARASHRFARGGAPCLFPFDRSPSRHPMKPASGRKSPPRLVARFVAISWRDLAVSFGPILLIAAVGIWVAVRLIQPAPPS